MNLQKNKRIRIGILSHGVIFPKFEANFIKKLLSNDNAEIVSLLVVQKREREHIYKKYNAWGMYEKRFVFPKMVSIYPEDLHEYFNSINKLKINLVQESKYAFKVDDQEINEIKKLKLDIIINCQYRILKGLILTTPRLGIWSLHNSDNQKYRGEPSGFWEIFNREKESGSVLQILTEKLDAGRILRKGTFITENTSIARHRDKLLMESSEWVNSAVNQAYFNRESIASIESTKTNAKIYKQPNFIKFLIFLFILGINNIKKMIHKYFFYEYWNIGILKSPIESIATSSPNKVEWLNEEQGYIYKADPFGYIDKDGILSIIFEEYDYLNSTGTIKRYNSRTSQIETFIDSKFHHSYPFIFHDDNKSYCIPECHQAKNITLHQIDENNKIVKKTIVLNGEPYTDSTIAKFNGYYWIFCTKSFSFNDSNTNLYCYYSPTFDGKYIEHPLNPIKSNIKNARPAGTPFVIDNILYRPSMDCSNGYGSKLIINKIKKINTMEYEEEVCNIIHPSTEYKDGIHHISTVGDKTLIDGKKIKFSLRYFFEKHIFRKSKKIINYPILDFKIDHVVSISELYEKFSLENIYSDGWIMKNSCMRFSLSKKLSMDIILEIPGWQREDDIFLKALLNDELVFNKKVNDGVNTVMFKLSHNNKIEFKFNRSFLISSKDKRQVSARIMSIKIRRG